MARTLNNEKSPAATRPNRAKIESKVMVSSDHQKDNDRINLLSSVEDDAADRHIDAGAYVEPSRNPEPDRNSKQKLTRIIDLRPTGIGEFIFSSSLSAKVAYTRGLSQKNKFLKNGRFINFVTFANVRVTFSPL